MKYHRFGRELVVGIGYRRFWHRPTRDEIHACLTQDLHLSISKREVNKLVVDFLALLCAAQPAEIRRTLSV